MNSIFESLFEYKNWMKFKIFPKTILQIVTNPAWAPSYIREELRKSELFFDDYINPIHLFVVLALLPWLVFNYLPAFGTNLSGFVSENTVSDRLLFFESQTDFVSSSKELEFFHIWTVEKMKADSEYEVIYREDHDPTSPYRFNVINYNTAQDRFYFEFTETGEYYITVYAGKFIPYRGVSVVAEIYMSSVKVIVPVKANEQVFISKTSLANPDEITDNRLYKNIITRPGKENILPFALGLLISPFLFALITKNSADDATLKEVFYVQCYYFSPICLAIWGTFFAFYFYTEDAFFFSDKTVVLQTILLAMALVVMWFIRTQVINLSQERRTPLIQSLITILICIALFGFAANVLFQISVYQDSFRIFAIRIWPLIAVTTTLSFVFAWYKRRRA